MNHDFVVIGGGIIGTSIARALRRRHPDASILLLEKEEAVGFHSSGRNSGVLHAGFYYTADSLKARFCRDGNLALREYILSKALPLNPCGKLVVAKDETEVPRLHELARRAEANRVEVELVDAARARAIEPRVRTHGLALWSPNTATSDPVAVLRAMQEDARAEGIVLRTGCRYEGRTDGGVRTNLGVMKARYIVNGAGLHADKVAADFGFSREYRILPFKGLYLYGSEPPGSFRTNIYPVPDLRNPFLGVHFTVTVDGRAKIGPTAIPALWREQYQGLDRFNLAEFVEIAWREAGLFLGAGFDFRSLALEEVRKHSRAHLVRLASALAEHVRLTDYPTWGRPGIRAQLIHVPTRRLEMDFRMEGDSGSFHVLNAVSPAWTCSLPFAEHVVDQLDKARNGTPRPST